MDCKNRPALALPDSTKIGYYRQGYSRSSDIPVFFMY